MTDPTQETPGIAWLPLLLAIVLALALTVYPHFLTDGGGKADHAAALAAMFAISAGFVRGVGFVPRHAVARWMFSTPACLLCVALALMQVFTNR